MVYSLKQLLIVTTR